ncbi:MAG: 2Fe-2S iron-sulfur cluster binding domain-containing protein [Acidiferrobacterales bacterium]|nr:2Fe-2S iron-sulfur cluster binding domain-containing protein [Acidiferrobacterales bacterium]
MPTIHYVLHDGTRHSIDAPIGDSVMLVALRNDFEGILAECGGACSCATCHVHIDPEWVNKLPEMDDLEQEMLDFAENVDDTSRLSCQLKITDEMDGLIVNVPESQY